MNDRSLGWDHLKHLKELLIVGSIVGVQIIRNVTINNNQMDLLFLKYLVQIFSNWCHHIDVLYYVAPISKGNHLSLSVLGSRIDEFNINPWIFMRGGIFSWLFCPSIGDVAEALLKRNVEERALMDVCSIKIDEGWSVDLLMMTDDFLESVLWDNVEEGAGTRLLGIEIDCSFFLRSLVDKDIAIVNPDSEGFTWSERKNSADEYRDNSEDLHHLFIIFCMNEVLVIGLWENYYCQRISPKYTISTY